MKIEQQFSHYFYPQLLIIPVKQLIFYNQRITNLNMKSAMNTSMDATIIPNKESSLQNTSFLKLSNLYIPSQHRIKPKHCRIKTDQFKPNQAQSTISTSIDLKGKNSINKNVKPNKKMSSSQTYLKKTRSQKNVSSVTTIKPNSITKPSPSATQKITIHRRFCTVESLQKLRYGLSTMNPQDAAKQHKSISQKIKQKTHPNNDNTKLLTEYQQLTTSLFDWIGNIRKRHEQQKVNQKQKHERRQKKIVKKYENLLQKNRNYSVLLNEISKQINFEVLMQQNKRHLKLKKIDD